MAIQRVRNGVDFFIFTGKDLIHGVGKRCYIRDFGTLVEDFSQYALDVKKENPDVPLFVAGESMGGLICANSAIHHYFALTALRSMRQSYTCTRAAVISELLNFDF